MTTARELGFVFEDPPPTNLGRTGVWPGRFSFLKQVPNVWLKIAVPTSAENAKRTAKRTAKRRGENFSVVGRTIDGKKFTFIRYNGK